MIIICHTCAAQNRLPAARIDQRAHCGQCKVVLSPPTHPLAIQSAADFDELVRDAPIPVVVDFWAAWCGPCRAVAPQIEALANTRTGITLVAKVDTEALGEVATRLSIRGIPTFILFRNGSEAKRVSGAMSADQIALGLGL